LSKREFVENETARMRVAMIIIRPIYKIGIVPYGNSLRKNIFDDGLFIFLFNLLDVYLTFI